MSSTLRSQLSKLAEDFASHVLAAIRGASLDELVNESRRALPAPSRHPAPAPSAPARAAAPAAHAPSAPPRKAPPGRLPRRTPQQIHAQVERVAGLLKGKRDGLRSEQIQVALGLDKREMPRVLQAGLTAKTLRSKGARRSTTYFAA